MYIIVPFERTSMRKTKDQKIKKLLQDPRKLYHIQDLAVLWGIDNSNSLRVVIKRYIKRGFLNKIHKGFYSTAPLDEIEPALLGLAALHRYAYLSTETILANQGLIFQELQYITLVSDISKRFEIAGHKFLVRQMKDDYLHNHTGVSIKNGVRAASAERAVADILYFNPDYHFDARDVIDWKKVKQIKHKIGY